MDARQFAVFSLVASLALAAPARAGNLLEQTPNIDGRETTPVGTIDFPFTHRFTLGAGKVMNSPTFTLSTGLTPRLDAAVRYATNSDLNAQYNELEARLRYQFLGGGPLRLTGEVAYNAAAVSADGALIGSADWGPLTLIASGRAFSSGYGVGGPTAAVGAGLIWRLTPYLGLSADVNDVLAAARSQAIANQFPTAGLAPAFGLGLNLAIPYSPHSLLLYATNANTHTLQGESRSDGVWRYGFTFEIPLANLARFTAIAQPAVAPAPSAAPHERQIVIRGYRFQPASVQIPAGTRVRWLNEDSVAHTVSADSGRWTSPLIAPGQSFTRVFATPGTTAYHCDPHPFMKGVVHVNHA